jgi:NitT/TauT family transport system ATP-binding protein
MTLAETAAQPLRSPSGAAVSVAGVSKVFGHGASRVVALDAIDITVGLGEFVCVVGASGCGKTTLLNLIAGLEDSTAGHIEVNGRCALMFQESALFPWLTAAKNVELALRLNGVGRRERASRAEELLELVHLGGFGDKRPHELSAACASGSRSRARSLRTPTYFSWTNRSVRSTP